MIYSDGVNPYTQRRQCICTPWHRSRASTIVRGSGIGFCIGKDEHPACQNVPELTRNPALLCNPLQYGHGGRFEKVFIYQ
jgi:hypothetical protein